MKILITFLTVALLTSPAFAKKKLPPPSKGKTNGGFVLTKYEFKLLTRQEKIQYVKKVVSALVELEQNGSKKFAKNGNWIQALISQVAYAAESAGTGFCVYAGNKLIPVGGICPSNPIQCKGDPQKVQCNPEIFFDADGAPFCTAKCKVGQSCSATADCIRQAGGDSFAEMLVNKPDLADKFASGSALVENICSDSEISSSKNSTNRLSKDVGATCETLRKFTRETRIQIANRNLNKYLPESDRTKIASAVGNGGKPVTLNDGSQVNVSASADASLKIDFPDPTKTPGSFSSNSDFENFNTDLATRLRAMIPAEQPPAPAPEPPKEVDLCSDGKTTPLAKASEIPGRLFCKVEIPEDIKQQSQFPRAEGKFMLRVTNSGELKVFTFTKIAKGPNKDRYAWCPSDAFNDDTDKDGSVGKLPASGKDSNSFLDSCAEPQKITLKYNSRTKPKQLTFTRDPSSGTNRCQVDPKGFFREKNRKFDAWTFVDSYTTMDPKQIDENYSFDKDSKNHYGDLLKRFENFDKGLWPEERTRDGHTLTTEEQMRINRSACHKPEKVEFYEALKAFMERKNCKNSKTKIRVMASGSESMFYSSGCNPELDPRPIQLFPNNVKEELSSGRYLHFCSSAKPALATSFPVPKSREGEPALNWTSGDWLDRLIESERDLCPASTKPPAIEQNGQGDGRGNT